jgi:hypothetical protein
MKEILEWVAIECICYKTIQVFCCSYSKKTFGEGTKMQ